MQVQRGLLRQRHRLLAVQDVRQQRDGVEPVRSRERLGHGCLHVQCWLLRQRARMQRVLELLITSPDIVWMWGRKPDGYCDVWVQRRLLRECLRMHLMPPVQQQRDIHFFMFRELHGRYRFLCLQRGLLW